MEHFSQRALHFVCSHINKVGSKLKFEKVEAYLNMDLSMQFFVFSLHLMIFFRKKSYLKVDTLVLREVQDLGRRRVQCGAR